jgi:hypothetical protein
MMFAPFRTLARSAVLAVLPLLVFGAAALAQETVTVRADAEDGLTTGWSLYDDTPSGTVTNVANPAPDPMNPSARAFRLQGAGPVQTDTGYRLTFTPAETTQFKLQWRMRFDQGYVIYVGANTSLGFRYLHYDARTTNLLGSDTYVHHGLGAGSYSNTDPRWVVFRRDLAADLAAAQPGNTLLSITGFLVRGAGYLDDIRTYDYPDADQDLIPDATEIALGLNRFDAGDAALDLDGDGLSNAREVVLGTNPAVADTDGDGLSDGEEVLVYGTDPLNPDTDGDTLPDGWEIAHGMSPTQAARQGNGYLFDCTVLEDATDGQTDGWDVYDVTPSGVVEAVDDEGVAAIRLTGGGTDTGFRFTFPRVERTRFKLQWRMKYSERFIVYVDCQTSAGHRYLTYTPDANSTLGTGEYVIHGLGTAAADGRWHTYRRDLARDLALAQPQNQLLSVRAFLIRGSGLIANISVWGYEDVDQDLIPDAVEIALGLNRFDAVDADLDLDGDGLSNANEIVYGTDLLVADSDGDGLEDGAEAELGLDPLDPTDAATVFHAASVVAGLEPGLLATYYQIERRTLPCFVYLPHYGSGTVATVNFPVTFGNFATSGRANRVAALFSGWLDVPADGYYRFYLTHNDGAALFIDGERVVNGDGYLSHTIPCVEHAGGMALAAGRHALRLEFFQTWCESALILEWKTPGGTRTLVPAANLFHDPAELLRLLNTDDRDKDGLFDVHELAIGTDPNNPDSDGDGLLDGEEVNTHLTNPLSADTDADGVGDYEEAMNACSDPLQADFDGTLTTLATLDGSAACATVGTWTADGAALVCRDRRGSADYAFALPDPGVWCVTVRGRQDNPLTAQRKFVIDAYIDGLYTGRAILDGPYGTPGRVRFYLPKLDAGTHTLRLDWRNGDSNTFLRILSIAIELPGGPDADENGVPDWLDFRLASANRVAADTPATSATSPVCIEGRALYPERLEALSSFVPDDTVLPVVDDLLLNTINRGLENRWFCDVPLDPAAATAIALSYENGARTEQFDVAWTETNALFTDAITVRVNDALLLTAFPEAATDGTMLIELENRQLTPDFDAPVPYTFMNPGTVSVLATYTPPLGDPVQNTMVVTVVGAAFNGAPFCIVGQPRLWDNPNIPDAAVLEYEPHLGVAEFALYPGRRLNMLMTQDKPARLLARLGTDGPVLAATRVDAVTYRNSSIEQFTVIETFADGSQLIEGRVNLGLVPADLVIKMHIFAGGITFDDGTVDKTFTAADFSATGELRYRFVRAPGAYPNTCHTIMFYQGATAILE